MLSKKNDDHHHLKKTEKEKTIVPQRSKFTESEREMRSLTLSESTLRAHSAVSPCPRPLKQHAHFLLPSVSVLKKHSSKLSCRHPLLIFSNYSRQWRGNPFEEELGGHSLAVSDYWDVLEHKEPKSKNPQATTEPTPILGDICTTEKSPAMIRSMKGNPMVALSVPYGGLLKFLVLFGYLTLEGSQQAVAGTDFASGLQSISYLGDLGDISTGFASAFLLIFFSELGDKTFFIAALLAARNPAAIVFTGTFGALVAMTIISVVLGRTFHYVDEILPFRLGETNLPVDDIAAVCLLVYFGISTLADATSGDGLKAEEEQKEAELAVSEFRGNGAGMLAAANTIISTFVLVFIAEWGDKSFFSTVALAAAASPLGVICGALAGHSIATLIAVLGGSLLGSFLSEKAIAYIGGVLFLVFAAVTLIEIVSSTT